MPVPAKNNISAEWSSGGPCLCISENSYVMFVDIVYDNFFEMYVIKILWGKIFCMYTLEMESWILIYFFVSIYKLSSIFNRNEILAYKVGINENKI